MNNKEIYQFCNWHGNNKEKHYFEGWYFKHQNDAEMLAVIPSFHIDESGQASCCIQLITNTGAHQLQYDAADFCVAKNGLYVKIGNNIFSQQGIVLDIQEQGVTCQGEIAYGPFSLLDYDIMGPFAVLPFMECNHGVISLSHQIAGQVVFNGKTMDFSSGSGYIEKDWGTSFPQSYSWLQWNSAPKENKKQCIMAAVARIPLLGLNFTGFLATVYLDGQEYRFATYNGAKLKYHSEQGIWLQKGDYELIVSNIKGEGHQLDAPQKGYMGRKVEEKPFCTGKILFLKNNIPLLQVDSNQISFEYVEK